MKVYKKNKGFTLIEVMIAVVVFSFGLLGVAGIMTVAVKNNHNGFMRTQASILAQSIADAMSKNNWSVWQNQYDGTFSGIMPVPSCAGGCTCAQAASRDTRLWGRMITQNLPNGRGIIACAQSAGATTAGVGTCSKPVIQPYQGVCTITINWNESNHMSEASAQTYVMNVRP